MSKIKTIFLTGVLVFSMAFMSACAGKTGDQQEAAGRKRQPLLQKKLQRRLRKNQKRVKQWQRFRKTQQKLRRQCFRMEFMMRNFLRTVPCSM